MSHLVRALLVRELQPRRVAIAASLVIVAAAVLGRQLAAQGLPPGTEPPATVAAAGGFGALLLARIGGLLAVPFGIGAAYLTVERVAGDHDAGWLPMLAAAGPPAMRGVYLLGVAGAVAAYATLLFAIAALTFALGGGRAAPLALADMLRALPGAAAFALSAAAYGTAWSALLRRRGAAQMGALAGVLVPVAILAWWQAAVGAPPEAVVRLLAAPMPPLVWHSAPDTLLRHALYAGAILGALTLLAPRLVARDR